MLALLSPAKTLDFETPASIAEYTQPRLLEQSGTLIDALAKLSPQDISSLMSISDKLGHLNHQRFQTFSTPFNQDNAKIAVQAFQGDVYTGLNAEALSPEKLKQSQNSLRILSGLYGLLKPLDLIQPYRLEMGTRFGTKGADNLYEFWGSRITDLLNQDIQETQSCCVINLASNEYYKSIEAKKLSVDVIQPVFKDEKNGQYKVISFYAKKARGMMARFIVEQNIKTPEKLKAFDLAGYRYVDEESTGSTMMFKRAEINPN